MNKKTHSENFNEKITRKEAIKKAGVTAMAATSLLLLNTKAEASGSACYPDGNTGEKKGGGGHGGHGGH